MFNILSPVTFPARVGTSVLLRKPALRINRMWPSLFIPEFLSDETVLMTIGVSDMDEVRRALLARTFRPLISTRFPPDRLPV